jgi:hypothetical protein
MRFDMSGIGWFIGLGVFVGIPTVIYLIIRVILWLVQHVRIV